jgi:uncharacterized protein YjbI with pentapeptide repeats
MLAAIPAHAATATSPAQKLEREKAQEEIRKLRAEVGDSTGIRGLVGLLAAPLTGLAAIAAITVSLYSLRKEQANQRRQREDAQRSQAEEKFANVLLSLGAEREAVQAGAAVSLLTFLGDDHQPYHEQVRWAVLANLKVEHSPGVRRLLVHVFETAMRAEGTLSPDELDLSHAFLSGVRLKGLTLDGAQLDGADLGGANLAAVSLVGAEGRRVCLDRASFLGGADLLNARLIKISARKATFGGANLVNAHLNGGNFEEASFAGARLQAAHLRNARLQGARFEGANVADTYFLGARLDRRSLVSLRQAENWTKAHFDPAIKARLDSIDA